MTALNSKALLEMVSEFPLPDKAHFNPSSTVLIQAHKTMSDALPECES